MDFLTKLFSRENTSKDVAKERLRLVLIQDRASIAPHVMQAMRQEIIKVISKYVEIDEARMEMDLASHANSMALTASIPVMRVKRGSAETQA